MEASKITAIDFFEDLTSPYARKRFFWGFIAICLLCSIGIYLNRSFLPTGAIRDVLDAVIIQMLSGSLIVLGFYGLYMHFIGPNLGLREVTVTRPRDIRERLEQLPLGARRYTFWGRSGAYFRIHPLLMLDEQSRKQKLVTDIDVVLPDPTDDRLIKSYQEILSSLGEDTIRNPLLANVLATSIACAAISSNNKYIKIKIFYSKFLPAFRVDMSDKGAILTQDDPAKSALFFQPESEFFEMLRTTIRSEMSVSREIIWDESIFAGREIDKKICDQQTLSAFGVEISNIDGLQQEVAMLLLKRQHRYK